MREALYSVQSLCDARLSRILRWRLRSVKKQHLTGLLMQGIIRSPARSMSPKDPSVAVWEGRTRLCIAMSTMHLPKWVPLPPGEHLLTFHASRVRSHSRFQESFTFGEGDILVAVCEPIQPWTFYKKSPSADTWHISLIGDSQDSPSGSHS